jgi:hypothetical protein
MFTRGDTFIIFVYYNAQIFFKENFTKKPKEYFIAFIDVIPNKNMGVYLHD